MDKQVIEMEGIKSTEQQDVGIDVAHGQRRLIILYSTEISLDNGVCITVAGTNSGSNFAEAVAKMSMRVKVRLEVEPLE